MASTEKKQASLEKSQPAGRVLRTDPFTVVDGHYVAHDGFIVPKNCDEFLQRFPEYVFRWVKKRLNGTAIPEDVEDWTQDLILHLRFLPEKSKHRLEGKTDVIETFDPVKQHGANQARFRSYVNLCLANRFNTIYTKRKRDALAGNSYVSLGGGLDSDEPGTVDDEFCHRESAHLQAAERRATKWDEDRLRVAEFAKFAERHAPGVLRAMDALQTTGSYADAARHLEMSYEEFRDLRRGLMHVGARLLSSIHRRDAVQVRLA